MKLRQIRTVMAVDYFGSMSSAAGALLVTQPAVTRTITLLEDDLGVKLFERNNCGTQATRSGRLLVRAGAKAFQDLKAMDRPARREKPEGLVCLESPFLRQVPDHELLALIELCQTRSIRRAAERLAVSRIAVARSIQSLSARLGWPLIDVSSTASSSSLQCEAAMKAKRALNHLAAVEQSLRDERTRNVQPLRLRVGALPASRVHLVPEALRRLSEESKASEFAIVDGGYDALLSKLLAGEVDIIVGSLRPTNQPSWIKAYHLFYDHLVIVARSGHPLLQVRDITWSHLQGARWVLPMKQTPIRTEFDALVERRLIGMPRHYIEADSFVSSVSLLISGDWLGIFSASQMTAEERAGRIQRLPTHLAAPSREVGAMIRRSEKPSRELNRFLDLLRQIASETRSLSVKNPTPVKPKLIPQNSN